MAKWFENVNGLLLDVTGVLYNSGSDGGTPISGSVQAIKNLQATGFPFKLCSNESTSTKLGFANKLRRHGFPVTADDIICPAPVMARRLVNDGLRPHLLVHPDVLPDFEECDTGNPNCVVVGDAQSHFTYEALNEAFRVLLSLSKKKLFALGRGKYYLEDGELVLDVGAYCKMLEYASGATMEACGKPEPLFYNTAVDLLDVPAEQIAMIGDDIVSDVEGAQHMGMKGVQVRTGKYRQEHDEPHATVKPDAYVNDLAEAVKIILQKRH